MATSQACSRRERTLPQQFSRPQLVVEGRRRAVQGKHRGGRRGGLHVVRVSGRLDWEGLAPRPHPAVSPEPRVPE